MKETDHLIWSNQYLDLEDWRESLLELYPDYSDDELYEKMVDSNNANLFDEQLNLNIQLSRAIIVIADLGLWSGRHSGYKEIQSGNIQDCLASDTDYNTWYVDEKGDLRCEAVHHDGTNYYLYREYKTTASEEDIEELKEKIYLGKCTEQDIEKVTRRLGDEIGKVYGWEFPQRTKELSEVGAR